MLDRRNAFVAAAVIAALCLPLLVKDYYLFQATMTLIMAIALLGLNVLVGYSGQVSLGHGAFFAVGAYTAAILMDRGGWNYAATIPIAGVVCFIMGFLFGMPASRLSGHYLALATFGLAAVLPQLLKHNKLGAFTGGTQGIVLDKPNAPFKLPISQDQWLYYLTLIVALVVFVLVWNLLRGRMGQVLVSVRDQPVAASAMGINVKYQKTVAFGLSAMLTGIGGALSAIVTQYVSPETFGMFLSISLLVGVVIGGLGTVSGALFGAVFVQFVPNLADSISKSAPWAVYGAILILTVFVAPTGVVGLIRAAARRLRRA